MNAKEKNNKCLLVILYIMSLTKSRCILRVTDPSQIACNIHEH